VRRSHFTVSCQRVCWARRVIQTRYRICEQASEWCIRGRGAPRVDRRLEKLGLGYINVYCQTSCHYGVPESPHTDGVRENTPRRKSLPCILHCRKHHNLRHTNPLRHEAILNNIKGSVRSEALTALPPNFIFFTAVGSYALKLTAAQAFNMKPISSFVSTHYMLRPQTAIIR
jgi:hypothetical protein